MASDPGAGGAKSNLRTFVHFVTESDKSPLPPFFKGGAENAPFRKGGRAQRGGISVGHCANVMWFDLAVLKVNSLCLRD